MAILLIFAFISGLVTIFAPCIWPLLPIILSSSATGGKKKALGITLGITISFALFTLAISYVIKIFPFDPNNLRFLAVIIIGFLGLSLVIPVLSSRLEGLVSRLSGSFGTKFQNPTTSGFWSGLITGVSLGIVWSPCAGPILATIATLAATQAVNFQVVLVTLIYVAGVGIPLFIFASVGNLVFTRTSFFSKYTGRVQQIFGLIMILTAIAIYTNYDKVLQAKLLDVVPSYGNFINKLESNQVVKQQLDALKGKETTPNTITSQLFNANTPAPEFIGITKWLNTDQPLTIKALKGKVVLVDFWTYTCINCIRTLPHVTAWYDKYKDQGFVVIGVHTPEFEFEKDTKNVENAIKQYNIHYPVPQDNAYATWNNYSNQYWPAEYLIDAKGIIRRAHFGEGEYIETEQAIQALLKEAGQPVNGGLEDIADQTPKARLSPETYLGSARMQYYYPGGSVGNGTQNFTLATDLPKNSFSFGGEWTIMNEYAIAGKNATLNYNFIANKVHLVLRLGTNKTAKVKIWLDEQVVDVITVDTDRLYNLIDLKDRVENHILKLEFETPGIEVFAFTFG